MRFAFAALLAATAAMAIPTATTQDSPSEVVKRAGTTHTVWIGDTISPQNVQAELGDQVEFHFKPGVHSVVESSSTDPCSSNGGFASTNVLTPNPKTKKPFAFVVEIKREKPIWYYNGASSACQRGVVGSINSPENGQNSISDFRRAAMSEHHTENPAEPKGGSFVQF